MKKITLFVGDCDSSIEQTAKQFDSEAILIDHNNIDKCLQDDCGYTGYTSLADLPKDFNKIFQLLNCADTLVYCPPTVWSDSKNVDIYNTEDSIQGFTEFILEHFRKTKNNVENLDLSLYYLNDYLVLSDCRKSNNPQLWISGGSDSDGVGVNQNERYGQLLADQLELPVSFLTAAGSSIEWTADQILRSDLREGDILIWAIPLENRFSFWSTSHNTVAHIHANHRLSDGKKINLPASTIDKILVEEKHNLYQTVIHIQQVINFCKASRVKLLIAGFKVSQLLVLHLHNVSNFIHYKNYQSYNNYIDLGNDNGHPGPKQHQAYADFCHSALKKLQYI